MPQKVLIISHTFPPAPGIGGRRWSKFAKYLCKLGYSVHVIAAENIDEETSNWTKDILGISVEYLPYKYPKVLSLPAKTVFQKISYRLALYWLKLIDRGNYYDKAILWKKQLHKKVSQVISEKNINCVIVTGAPFRLMYYTTLLKKEFPNVKFISDFRDLWTEDLELSAMSGHSDARRQMEKYYEKQTLINSDTILTVSDGICEYFSKIATNKKCSVIPNGFDPEDLKLLKPKTSSQIQEKNCMRFVFAGTVYRNLSYLLVPLFKALSQLKTEKPELYSSIKFLFYGKFPNDYKPLIKEHNVEEVIKIMGQVNYETIANEVQNAHYCLLILNDVYNNSFSTKFCEYLGQKKKMLVLSNGGITADFVTNNQLGYYLNPTSIYDDLLKSINRVIENKFEIESIGDFNSDYFSVDKITLKLEELINN